MAPKDVHVTWQKGLCRCACGKALERGRWSRWAKGNQKVLVKWRQESQKQGEAARARLDQLFLVLKMEASCAEESSGF